MCPGFCYFGSLLWNLFLIYLNCKFLISYESKYPAAQLAFKLQIMKVGAAELSDIEVMLHEGALTHVVHFMHLYIPTQCDTYLKIPLSVFALAERVCVLCFIC